MDTKTQEATREVSHYIENHFIMVVEVVAVLVVVVEVAVAVAVFKETIR